MMDEDIVCKSTAVSTMFFFVSEGSFNIRVLTKFWDHIGVWPKVSLVFEDSNFEISEVSDQNWSFPVSAHLAVLMSYAR